MSRLNTFLAGTRVLDLSRHLPGPLATLLLADMGADVIKIEPPAGDEMRSLGPRADDGASIYFEAVNAGKTTRRMDLTIASMREEFLALVAGADVLVESFRPGVMTRLGVGYAVLKEVNPRLVYCSLNGFGHHGPLAQVPAHDVNYLALAGALHHNGGSPPFFDPPFADCAGALFAVIAILGALHGRARDGRGCEIDLAIADAMMPLELFHLAELGAGIAPRPREGILNGGAACYNVYTIVDDVRVSLGALEPKFWRAFCLAAERPDWIARHDDPLPQLELKGELAAMFGTLTLAECNARFTSCGCCFAPILDLRAAIDSPHYRDRGLVRESSTGIEAVFPAIVDGEPPAAREPLKDQAPVHESQR
jgi:crotonobetainyl-CoA:carnitine CoA-transferase CaiB-like acyl-CoA transferase